MHVSRMCQGSTLNAQVGLSTSAGMAEERMSWVEMAVVS